MSVFYRLAALRLSSDNPVVYCRPMSLPARTAKQPTTKELDREARWPGFAALILGTALHYVLPERLSAGPSWLLPAVMAVLMIPILASHRRGWLEAARVLTFLAVGALTLALIASLALLIQGLPGHKDNPATLLRSAAVLWLTNVLTFALWYWKLDAGGPTGRDNRKGPVESSFLFPQMTMHPLEEKWSPEFIDYLFVAFNTSTAFSPTDTPVLGRWAKVLSMLQALISLTVLAVLAARAINVL
jgi:uncharacterized membrane protein